MGNDFKFRNIILDVKVNERNCIKLPYFPYFLCLLQLCCIHYPRGLLKDDRNNTNITYNLYLQQFEIMSLTNLFSLT